MSEEHVQYRKVRGQCDTCSKLTWVTTEILDNVVVAAYCKACDPAKKN